MIMFSYIQPGSIELIVRNNLWAYYYRALELLDKYFSNYKGIVLMYTTKINGESIIISAEYSTPDQEKFNNDKINAIKDWESKDKSPQFHMMIRSIESEATLI